MTYKVLIATVAGGPAQGEFVCLRVRLGSPDQRDSRRGGESRPFHAFLPMWMWRARADAGPSWIEVTIGMCRRVCKAFLRNVPHFGLRGLFKAF